MKLQIYEPLRTIIPYKENIDELYFIYSGAVQVFDQDQEIPLLTLIKGSYFGDFQILLKIKSNYRYMSYKDKAVVMFTLDSEKFKSILKIHPNEKTFLTNRAKKRYLHLKRARNEIRESIIRSSSFRKHSLEEEEKDADDILEFMEN